MDSWIMIISDLVVQLRLLEFSVANCNECLQPTFLHSLRRCESCEDEVRARIKFRRVVSASKEVQLTSVKSFY